MTTSLLIILVLFDIGLIVAMFYLNKKQESHGDLLLELTEERRLLSDLKNTVREEISKAQKQNREAIAKMSHLAAEAEQEVKKSGTNLASGMAEVFDELNVRFEKPLNELVRRQAAVEALSKRIVKEKEQLIKLITRGEALVKFFDEKTPFEEVMKDMENKKFEDCRHLLAQGMTEDQVANELGMSKSEIKLVSGLI